jgi:general secretion pathway protein E
VAQVLRREVVRVVANPLDVNRYLMEFYGVTRAVRKAKDQKDERDSSQLLNFEQLVELGKGGELGAEDQHVVRIVDWLLQYAYEQRASDIHLEPRRDVSRMRFRIDGVLHRVFELPTPVMQAVTARVKILGRMDVAERRRPQDGRLKMKTLGGREVEMRLSIMPTAFGEKCVMRIFDPELVLKNFGDLGLTQTEEQVWRGMIERPHGIVLVTGPTGSGKTTTLYSTLKHLATPDLNVCTGRGPDRDGGRRVQPDAGADQHRPDVRGRRAHAAAPGPRHHHGGRDPRPRDRGDGGAGLAHRAPRAVHAPHQRRARAR